MDQAEGGVQLSCSFNKDLRGFPWGPPEPVPPQRSAVRQGSEPFYAHVGRLLYLSSAWRGRINLGEVLFSEEGHSWERT